MEGGEEGGGGEGWGEGLQNPCLNRAISSALPLLAGRSLRSCYSTGWLNEFDQAFTYRSPPGFVVTGMASYHQNAQE